MQVGEPTDPESIYISWWPSAQLDQLKKAPGTTQSLVEDIVSEGREPDASIDFEELPNKKGLDEKAIRKWWIAFQSEKVKYGLGGKNCSWVVISALRAGGSDKFFPWYRVNIKRNIPLKSVLMPIVIPLLQFITVQHIAIVPTALSAFRVYVASFAKELKGGASFKLAAVAAVDAFSSIWSPEDTLAFCIVLKENLERRKAGETLLGTSAKTSP
jgi:hypothetical protein